MKNHNLSNTAAQHCAQNLLRYKETHGASPSADQTAKIAPISQQFGYQEYARVSHNRDTAESGFLPAALIWSILF